MFGNCDKLRTERSALTHYTLLSQGARQGHMSSEPLWGSVHVPALGLFEFSRLPVTAAPDCRHITGLCSGGLPGSGVLRVHLAASFVLFVALFPLFV